MSEACKNRLECSHLFYWYYLALHYRIAYFANLKGSGKNAIGERHTMVLNDNAVVVTGFYDFTRMKSGQPVPGPSRFTMLLIKYDGEWLIAHHHSSPRGPLAN